MPQSSLDHFVNQVRRHWTGLNSETITRTHESLRELTSTPEKEPWLSEIHQLKPATKKLYQDPDQGFILLAHAERRGLYRPPHDHGAGWVFYAVQHGESRMTTYKAITFPNGATRLVSRGAFKMTNGHSAVFLPRDIHDTECCSDYLIQFRLTSSDFSREKEEGRMIQYTETSVA